MQAHTDDGLQARDYQIHLVETAVKQNTIIYLPTGAGKTFIAVMILRKLAKSLEKPITQGGKISIMVVNTHALVNQQSQYLQRHTPFKVLVGGSKKPIGIWKQEINKHQILVSTPKMLMNMLEASVLSLSNVNLLIFDECHHAAKNHPMSRLMINFKELKEQPRIVGLSATLLNKNCTANKVVTEVEMLEATLYSEIATVDLQHLIGFSTMPKEILKTFVEDKPLIAVVDATARLQNLIHEIENIRLWKGRKNTVNLIQDIILHIEMFGSFGGRIAVMTSIEKMKIIEKNCPNDSVRSKILNVLITTLLIINKIFDNAMADYSENKCLCKFSTQKVQTLINILREYGDKAREPLCGIIFVQRRFTAKILYHVLLFLRAVDPAFKDIRPNFVLGSGDASNKTLTFSQNTYAKIIQQFHNKEINLLIASNVLEEGVDVPLCNLVVHFDIPSNYRAYVQSKGRARHTNSFYCIMVNVSMYEEFKKAYEEHQNIENILNNYLVSRIERQTVNDENIHQPTGNCKLPTHCTADSQAAEVDLTSAVNCLYQYCSSLPSDKYSSYQPNWRLENTEIKNRILFRIIIELPAICRLTEPTVGPYMQTKDLAKEAAALKVCQLLHETGELDENHLPKHYDVVDENKDICFKHWPEQEKLKTGNSKKERMCVVKIPDVCRGQVQPNKTVYLHLIELKPTFSPNSNIVSESQMHQIYCSQLCYGLLTAQALPQLCEFPVYVPAGEITVDVKVNQKTITLTVEQVVGIRIFHYLIFKDLLELVKPYLVFNNDKDAEILLVVPIQKEGDDCAVDFDTVHKNQKLESFLQKDKRLVVSEENYLNKIVALHTENMKYLVTSISPNITSLNGLPDKRQLSSSHMKPLLVAKALLNKVSHLKPQSNKETEELEHLLPELCIVYNFPSDLWIQASLLPSILYRITSLLQTDELRRRIAAEARLGVVELKEGECWLPLVLDEHLSNYTVEESSKLESQTLNLLEPNNGGALSPTAAVMCNRDVMFCMNKSEVPCFKAGKLCDLENNLPLSFNSVKCSDQFVAQQEHLVDKPEESKITASTEHNILTKDFVKTDIALLRQVNNNRGPELAELLKALTTAKSSDIVNLERLETLGDSFLQFSITLFIILKHPNYSEGKASILRAHLISNKNLYYIGVTKTIDEYLQVFDVTSTAKWKPPCFHVPRKPSDKITVKHSLASSLINFRFSNVEQVSGILEEQTDECNDLSSKDENAGDSIFSSPDLQKVSNKTVADSIEALLAVYFQSCGFMGGFKFLEWLEIIPESTNLLNMQISNPLLTTNIHSDDIDTHIALWHTVEEKLGYQFKNRAYLLQALTHASYTRNHITNCYQTLEFLGDAVLDFLITCHIYETCQNLNPGQLTDLRSALVNNLTFAGFTVRCGFHKFILLSNSELLRHIDNFVKFQESKNFAIDDEVLILFEETELNLAEQVEVPKILGDIFEALAAAVYLDSGMNLETVWTVFYAIMWREIESFRQRVPKNAVRLLYETVEAKPQYHEPVKTDTGGTVVGLDFTLNGNRKTVYGFGQNKFSAKKAAAKIALRVLRK